MDRVITTYETLSRLVELDKQDHKLKDIAVLFLNAMNDWPTYNQTEISEFVRELKEYFGTTLTIERIESKKINLEIENNAWRHEAGSLISDMIELSRMYCNEDNFETIIKNILDYYEKEFQSVDFIAELKYRTTEEGGRKTPACSGYRPQVKFDFTEKETSGQQIFIGKDKVYPGETVEAKIKILSVDFFAKKLMEGMKFEFREGSTIIGYGLIKQIINDKLIKASS